MRQAVEEGSLEIATIRVIVFTIAMRLTIVPLSFVNDGCSIVLEESVWLYDSPLRFKSTIAFVFDWL